MKYSDFRWDRTGVVIVYGADESARKAFRETFASTHRDFCSTTFDYIRNYKKGFLQRDRTIVEVLVDHVPKAQRAAFAEKLKGQIDRVGLTTFKDRTPKAMAGDSQYRWTVLASALQGQRKLLVYDSGDAASHSGAMQMVRWLYGYDAKMSVVWLTGIPEETLLEEPFFLNIGAAFYSAENGGLTEITRDEMLEKKESHEIRKQQIEAERRARWEAEMAAKMEKGIALEKAEKYVEALAVYEPLCEERYIPAMLAAAKLYFASKGSQFFLDQWDRAKVLCRRADTAESWIVMGDHEARNMSKAIEDYNKNPSQDDKHHLVNRLAEAGYCYRQAAETGSPEGIYKAAEFHLMYNYSRYDSKTGFRFNYTQADALPYIKQLIAMKEAGRAGVHLHLIDIQIRYGKQYEKALKEYREENQ